MKNYKLLTPGPLTTTDTVKQQMLFDHCTWDDAYKEITQKIRRDLLTLAHVCAPAYTTVLMQGSGSFGVESVLSSVIGKNDKLLLASNGAYGERMAQMAAYHNIACTHYQEPYDVIPSADKIESILKQDPSITHIAMVHCETTSGILNDIAAIGAVAKHYDKTFIVDAMSSFGGIDLNMEKIGIDFLISSANKCIQGVPGFSFILANRQKLLASKGNARSLCLDLYDQWVEMEKDGKWRYTSPTHTVLAFATALEELAQEGGIPAREQRYRENHALLLEKFSAIGFEAYIEPSLQSPIITTFCYPNEHFSFDRMYHYIKERGYAIYPGKLTELDTFRVGNIGEIYPEDMDRLASILSDFLQEEQQ